MRDMVRQAAARLGAQLPEGGQAERVAMAVQGQLWQQWSRLQPQRQQLGRRLRQGSALLAQQPVPDAVRQGLGRLEAWLDRHMPEDAASDAAEDEATTRQQVAHETLVSPLDDASLDLGPSDDNCFASGTSTSQAAAAPSQKAPAPAGRSRPGSPPAGGPSNRSRRGRGGAASRRGGSKK